MIVKMNGINVDTMTSPDNVVIIFYLNEFIITLINK